MQQAFHSRWTWTNWMVLKVIGWCISYSTVFNNDRFSEITIVLFSKRMCVLFCITINNYLSVPENMVTQILNRSGGIIILWLKGGICPQLCHYLYPTKDEDNPILYIVTFSHFLPIIPEFCLAISNLFLEMPISAEYVIHFYFKFNVFLSIFKNICSRMHCTFKDIAYVNYWAYVIASTGLHRCQGGKHTTFILNFVPYKGWDRKIYIFFFQMKFESIPKYYWKTIDIKVKEK